MLKIGHSYYSTSHYHQSSHPTRPLSQCCLHHYPSLHQQVSPSLLPECHSPLPVPMNSKFRGKELHTCSWQLSDFKHVGGISGHMRRCIQRQLTLLIKLVKS